MTSLLKEILSSVDPAASTTSPAPSPVSRLPLGSPKPAQRPAGPTSGGSEPPPLKRKASGPVDGAQAKIQRKDAPARPVQTNGAPRPAPAPASGGVKPTPNPSTTTVPYRGTAGLGASKPTNAPVKRPSPRPTPQPQPKAAAPAPKPVLAKPVAPTAGSASSGPQKKVGGYMAMLMKAKEKEQTKPATPLVKVEPAKIMTKKDRELARLQAKAAAKGKKPAAGLPRKALDGKANAGKEKRKPAELGYQGTARPAKKPAEIGYKGTARPSSAGPPVVKPGPAAAKAKPKPSQSRYGGYASWSDVEEDEVDEDDYASDASSDMEGNLWDVEEEETMALKVAKQEDAAALAEEARLKRDKEERKRKLMAMNKAAASKRKY
ncbi:hypothetical protein K458DRAFT_341225 [Lentithecium fluviatile CBS 122367]|uniref:SPT2-domain-containing protein n=1 Tax=Lentithecium fluviatile CBS 122367 TaxID=1168545 RepID=A0A6G1IWT4_9PLEO|nr:hypothetical protein K458DRAFT_341225 [Lentithecium fluviatile CBS 122367]